MLSRIAVLLALLVTTIWATNAWGGAKYRTNAQPGVTITLYTDACKLKEVTNLPGRAVWFENGKEVEGCWAARNDIGIVVAYFADKTVAIIPGDVFEPLTGV